VRSAILFGLFVLRSVACLVVAMSAVIRRNHEGVVLRYTDPADLQPHHVERRSQVSDSQRSALIKAECELLTLWIIAEHIDISDIGMRRIADAIETIRRGLEAKRREYGT
jgi:hypothetical protein